MKPILVAVVMLLSACFAMADDVEVTSLRMAGPFAVPTPVMVDAKDVNAKEFSNSALLDGTMSFDALKQGKTLTDGVLPSDAHSASINLAGFTLCNTIYTTATITVSGVKDYRIYVDGKKLTGGVAELSPSVHQVVVKCLTNAGQSDTLKVKVDSDKCTIGETGANTKRTFNIYDVLHGKQYTAANISPDGKWLMTNTYTLNTSGNEVRKSYLWNLQTGTKRSATFMHWMPRTNKLMHTNKNNGQSDYTLLCVDPATMEETVITEHLPQSSFTMSPTEDFVIYSVTTNGPKEDSEVYEVVNPDDRQPGWRNRTNLYKYDFKTGIAYPLTFGHHSVGLAGISQDGQYALIMTYRNNTAAMRPTDFTSLYRLNINTMQMDTLVVSDGFITDATLSPDGNTVAVEGSPECFGGIGMNVAEGQTPSNYDYQLYLFDVNRRIAACKADSTNFSDVSAVTRDFNPNVGTVRWSAADGMIYFSAEDKDCVHLFKLNPTTKAIQQIAIPEDAMGRYSISTKAGTIAYYAQSAANADRLYTLNPKQKGAKSKMIEDLCKDDLADVQLSECHRFTWVNPEGDSICCTYYLPPFFDSTKQYPMIVNYYGGCSPTSRTFAGGYPKHAYAALGYVVLVINPRGATGFGQKWAAMHVNTAGKYIADDIIGAVKAFTSQHSFVNDKKIGCIGASYGGFMTQYLQTQTDIFAAAVSHAGISDHTSYWGEGYWGYSYSQTSMANSYPWTRRDLYVDQSPLFNADKIHTPLLFVHGTSDTNVPVGESIQMYTALKLLGRPTAMVLVEGENHWILNYNKRLKWQNTIWAWFAKWLQDDSSWWESMYKDKEL